MGGILVIVVLKPYINPINRRVRRNAGLCFSVKTGVFYAFLEVKFTKKSIHPYSKSFAGCLCIIFILV